MDTVKMVSEIKSTCAVLEKKKAELLSRVKEIDDKLSYYNIAIQGLEQTITEKDAEQKKTWSRKPVLIEYNGITQSITAWANQLGLAPKTIRGRMEKGLPMSKVLTSTRARSGRKPKAKAKPSKVFVYDSFDNVIRQFTGIGDASRSLNMPESTVKKIIEKMSKDDQLRVRNYYLAYVA